MDIEKINSIVELFKNSGLDEMTLELKDFKINLKNNKVEYVAKEVVNVVEKSSPELLTQRQVLMKLHM